MQFVFKWMACLRSAVMSFFSLTISEIKKEKTFMDRDSN
jgi:hypothetical protein